MSSSPGASPPGRLEGGGGSSPTPSSPVPRTKQGSSSSLRHGRPDDPSASGMRNARNERQHSPHGHREVIVWDGPEARRYEAEVLAVLHSFDKAKEWADLNNCLQKLLRVFSPPTTSSFAFSAAAPPPFFPFIPHKAVVAKRLAQCLNPLLPSGVHTRALETYAAIFERIGPDGLSGDLAIYSAGLLPFFQDGATHVKPLFLDLINAYYLPLGRQLIPCLSGLLVSVLPGLDDDKAPVFTYVLSTVWRLRDCVGERTFAAALWLALRRASRVRLAALSVLNQLITPSLPALLDDKERISALLPDREELVIGALEATFGDPSPLVKRQLLDVLIKDFPFDRPLLTRRETVRLLRAALRVLPLREWSLTRRFIQWITTHPDGILDVIDLSFLSKHVKGPLIETFKLELESHPSSTKEATYPLKSLSILIVDNEDLDGIAQELMPSLTVPLLRYLLRESANPTWGTSVLQESQQLFHAKLTQPDWAWAALGLEMQRMLSSIAPGSSSFSSVLSRADAAEGCVEVLLLASLYLSRAEGSTLPPEEASAAVEHGQPGAAAGRDEAPARAEAAPARGGGADLLGAEGTGERRSEAATLGLVDPREARSAHDEEDRENPLKPSRSVMGVEGLCGMLSLLSDILEGLHVLAPTFDSTPMTDGLLQTSRDCLLRVEEALHVHRLRRPRRQTSALLTLRRLSAVSNASASPAVGPPGDLAEGEDLLVIAHAGAASGAASAASGWASAASSPRRGPSSLPASRLETGSEQGDACASGEPAAHAHVRETPAGPAAASATAASVLSSSPLSPAGSRKGSSGCATDGLLSTREVNLERKKKRFLCAVQGFLAYTEALWIGIRANADSVEPRILATLDLLSDLQVTLYRMHTDLLAEFEGGETLGTPPSSGAEAEDAARRLARSGRAAAAAAAADGAAADEESSEGRSEGCFSSPWPGGCLPTWFCALLECSQVRPLPVACRALQSFLHLFNAFSPARRRFIVLNTSHCDEAAVRLWEALAVRGLDGEPRGVRAPSAVADLLLQLEASCCPEKEDVVQAVLLRALQAPNPQTRCEAIERFSLLWRCAHLQRRAVQQPLYALPTLVVLRALEETEPRIRHAARAFLRQAVHHLPHVLDPIFELLLHVDAPPAAPGELPDEGGGEPSSVSSPLTLCRPPPAGQEVASRLSSPLHLQCASPAAAQPPSARLVPLHASSSPCLPASAFVARALPVAASSPCLPAPSSFSPPAPSSVCPAAERTLDALRLLSSMLQCEGQLLTERMQSFLVAEPLQVRNALHSALLADAARPLESQPGGGSRKPTPAAEEGDDSRGGPERTPAGAYGDCVTVDYVDLFSVVALRFLRLTHPPSCAHDALLPGSTASSLSPGSLPHGASPLEDLGHASAPGEAAGRSPSPSPSVVASGRAALACAAGGASSAFAAVRGAAVELLHLFISSIHPVSRAKEVACLVTVPLVAALHEAVHNADAAMQSQLLRLLRVVMLQSTSPGPSCSPSARYLLAHSQLQLQQNLALQQQLQQLALFPAADALGGRAPRPVQPLGGAAAAPFPLFAAAVEAKKATLLPQLRALPEQAAAFLPVLLRSMDLCAGGEVRADRLSPEERNSGEAALRPSGAGDNNVEQSVDLATLYLKYLGAAQLAEASYTLIHFFCSQIMFAVRPAPSVFSSHVSSSAPALTSSSSSWHLRISSSSLSVLPGPRAATFASLPYTPLLASSPSCSSSSLSSPSLSSLGAKEAPAERRRRRDEACDGSGARPPCVALPASLLFLDGLSQVLQFLVEKASASSLEAEDSAQAPGGPFSPFFDLFAWSGGGGGAGSSRLSGESGVCRLEDRLAHVTALLPTIVFSCVAAVSATLPRLEPAARGRRAPSRVEGGRARRRHSTTRESKKAAGDEEPAPRDAEAQAEVEPRREGGRARFGGREAAGRRRADEMREEDADRQVADLDAKRNEEAVRMKVTAVMETLFTAFPRHFVQSCLAVWALGLNEEGDKLVALLFILKQCRNTVLTGLLPPLIAVFSESLRGSPAATHPLGVPPRPPNFASLSPAASFASFALARGSDKEGGLPRLLYASPAFSSSSFSSSFASSFLSPPFADVRLTRQRESVFLHFVYSLVVSAYPPLSVQRRLQTLPAAASSVAAAGAKKDALASSATDYLRLKTPPSAVESPAHTPRAALPSRPPAPSAAAGRADAEPGGEAGALHFGEAAAAAAAPLYSLKVADVSLLPPSPFPALGAVSVQDEVEAVWRGLLQLVSAFVAHPRQPVSVLWLLSLLLALDRVKAAKEATMASKKTRKELQELFRFAIFIAARQFGARVASASGNVFDVLSPLPPTADIVNQAVTLTQTPSSGLTPAGAPSSHGGAEREADGWEVERLRRASEQQGLRSRPSLASPPCLMTINKILIEKQLVAALVPTDAVEVAAHHALAVILMFLVEVGEINRRSPMTALFLQVLCDDFPVYVLPALHNQSPQGFSYRYLILCVLRYFPTRLFPAGLSMMKKALLENLPLLSFFSIDRRTLRSWERIGARVVSSDPQKLDVLLPSPHAGVFASKESDLSHRLRYLKRLAFLLLCSSKDVFQPQLAVVLEKLTEALKLNAANQAPGLTEQVFLCIRVLLLRLSSSALTPVWPIVLTELIKVFSSATSAATSPRSPPASALPASPCSSSSFVQAPASAPSLSLLLAALKVVDLAALLDLPEFRLYQWMFVEEHLFSNQLGAPADAAAAGAALEKNEQETAEKAGAQDGAGAAASGVSSRVGEKKSGERAEAADTPQGERESEAPEAEGAQKRVEQTEEGGEDVDASAEGQTRGEEPGVGTELEGAQAVEADQAAADTNEVDEAASDKEGAEPEERDDLMMFTPFSALLAQWDGGRAIAAQPSSSVSSSASVCGAESAAKGAARQPEEAAHAGGASVGDKGPREREKREDEALRCEGDGVSLSEETRAGRQRPAEQLARAARELNTASVSGTLLRTELDESLVERSIENDLLEVSDDLLDLWADMDCPSLLAHLWELYSCGFDMLLPAAPAMSPSGGLSSAGTL
ncbi:hypothetical protein BESB_035770 [Besnoitia besnoiti]|uniref:Uncharacterized protein n=1 Tax=Besnoitia besnoiti TaxID=94643 RepID=A0A2A9MGT2_BESBE|nr:hypothetical protein BESB_035770 [Besnoitia besnoiti]PFH37119.1 hypothetical protein BESB_035770 [Besnoitia besnoiti]